MNKKLFLCIPVFFILYSVIFPCMTGTDYVLKQGIAGEKTDKTLPVTELSENGRNVTLKDGNGKKIGSYRGDAPLTAADTSGNVTVLGFADGRLAVSDSDHPFYELEYESPGNIEIIYSVSVSGDGKHIAAVAGLHPRKVIFFHRKHDRWVRGGSDEISDTHRRSTFIEFYDDILLFEDKGGITGINLADFNHFRLEFEGNLRKITYDSRSGIIYVHEGENFRMYYNDGRLIAVVPDNGKSLDISLERG